MIANTSLYNVSQLISSNFLFVTKSIIDFVPISYALPFYGPQTNPPTPTHHSITHRPSLRVLLAPYSSESYTSSGIMWLSFVSGYLLTLTLLLPSHFFSPPHTNNANGLFIILPKSPRPFDFSSTYQGP